jgi:hypothetical protein
MKLGVLVMQKQLRRFGFLAVLAVVVGVMVEIIEGGSFSHLNKSLMDLAILGKIPGTTHYADYYSVGYAIISFAVTVLCISLYQKGRHAIKTSIVTQEPEHISL